MSFFKQKNDTFKQKISTINKTNEHGQVPELTMRRDPLGEEAPAVGIKEVGFN